MAQQFPQINFIKELLSTIFRQATGKVRPWKEFFSGFKVPELDDNRLLLRSCTNFIYYSGNYLIIVIIMLLIQMVLNPYIAFCYILVTVGWIILFTLESQGIYINKTLISQTTIISIGHVVILLFLGCLPTFLWNIFFSLLIIVVHSCFRKRSLRSKIAVKSIDLPIPLNSIINDDCESAPLLISKMENDTKRGLNYRNQHKIVIRESIPLSDDFDSE